MYGLLNDGLWKYNRTVWIAVPVYNFSLFLDDCFKSINKQTYKNIHLCIFNDGSSDDSNKNINRWIPVLKRTGITCHIMNFSINKGPGYTKWKAIEYIREKAKPTDIFTILDGDDYYTKEHAIERILMEYIKTGCWLTYGSAEGENTKQGKQIAEFNRCHRNSFPFQHPRSCSIHLLKYFNKEDFKDHEGQWIQRGSDRQFIYKCIELSGIDRISFISEELYFYRTHKNNVRNKISKEYKIHIEDMLIKKPPAIRITDTIDIVMCSYKRQKTLADIIKSIDEQKCDKQIVLHIINTNTDEWESTQDIINNTLIEKIQIKLINTNDNLYGYARFLYVKHLLDKKFVQYVIFIDDDQILKPDWVKSVFDKREPFSYMCWHGRNFKRIQGEEISYWKSDLLYDDIVKNKAGDVCEYEYGATSGCIIDSHIFNFEIVFRCPLRFRMIEDLWLSFVVKHILGMPILRLFFTPNINEEELYNKHNDDSLFLKIKEKKQACLRELIGAGFLVGDIIKMECLNKILVNDDSKILLDTFTFL
jgi:glycosyltransferase involved in cell wall biosynthesis